MKGERPVTRAAQKSKRAAERSKELAEQDDLLLGSFEREPSRARLGAFFAISIGASLYAWQLAFAFGTHRTLFYYRRQELFVVSLAVLLGSLILRRRVHTRPWVLGLFAPPLLLVMLRLAVPVNESRGVVRVVEQVLVTTTLVVLPIVIWVIARLVAPDYFSLPDWRLKLAVLAVAATVGVIGLLFGRFNDRFLTCEVIVAGDKPPPNCVHVRR